MRQVLDDRGYPSEDDWERGRPTSPSTIRKWSRTTARATVSGTAIALRGHGKGDTEDLRLAMTRFRGLFDELLEGERVEEEVR